MWSNAFCAHNLIKTLLCRRPVSYLKEGKSFNLQDGQLSPLVVSLPVGIIRCHQMPSYILKIIASSSHRSSQGRQVSAVGSSYSSLVLSLGLSQNPHHVFTWGHWSAMSSQRSPVSYVVNLGTSRESLHIIH